MAVMGEESPERWSEELRRAGRVVFPLRRRPMIWSLAYGLVLSTPVLVRGLPNLLEAGGAQRITAIALIVLYVLWLASGAWQFRAQRPAVTVDREGIRRGRRKFMPWTEIGAIGLATGPVWGRSLPIIPKDVWAKDLILRQQNIRDLPAFRRWLETLLDEHRRSVTSAQENTS